LKDKSFSTKNK